MSRDDRRTPDDLDSAAGDADEPHQARPSHSSTQEALLSLLRTADAAKRRFADLFARAGVTFQQYNVLRILRGAMPEGLPTLDIGDRMIERTPGVTRIVDRLERKGWVSRTRDTGDRRRVYCCISAEGLDLLASLDPAVNEIDSGIFEGVADADVKRLAELLDELRARMAEHTTERSS